jgi:hypothetical protein
MNAMQVSDKGVAMYVKHRRDFSVSKTCFSYVRLVIVSCITGLILFHVSFAADDQALPGSNADTETNCANTDNIQKASLLLEAEITKAAVRGYKRFLEKIIIGEEGKFGFNNRGEIAEAIIGAKLYQMHIRCNGTDFPTNLWRIPIAVQNEPRALLSVEWIEGGWRVVGLGAATLAQKLYSLEQGMIEKYGLQDTQGVHRVIIRNYKERTDYFQLKPYTADGKIEITAILTFPEVIQEQSQWCWAGVSAALFDYFKAGVPQCEIADYARTVATWHDFGSVDCCVDPDMGCNYWNYNWGYDGSIEDILESMQKKIAIQNYGLSRKLTLTEVETDLSGNKPFVIRWGWDSGGGHFLVGYGIDEDLMNYMDPWFGEGHMIGTYDWVSLGGGHTWTHTNRITEVIRSIISLPSNMLLLD